MADKNTFLFIRKVPGMFWVWLALLFITCSNIKDHKHQSPGGYDLSQPYIIKLPLELDEISGIQYYEKDTSILAITDEKGWLYKIFLNNPKTIEKWKFHDKADYEDLLLIDSVFYVLKSNGELVEFYFSHADTVRLQEISSPLPKGKNEFETLYYDAFIKKIVVVCKNCESNGNKAYLGNFTFDMQSRKYENGPLNIKIAELRKIAGEKKKFSFKPSAAAFNPLTNDLFIISSINKLLVIADRKGNIKSVYKLRKSIFKQPEGICFAPWGTMFISNESGGSGVGEILIFPYRKNNQK